ncbi:MAG: molybdopterin-dependent oxidoreductase [Dehalococcoidales bacterium]|nr:molybdopterin-dependent oxidoreductase [Dehalococcoidales bacterium]
MDKPRTTSSEEQSYIKDISWCAESYGSNTSMVDVSNGKIVRIRPFRYDWKYDPQEFNPWKLEVRGKTFEPQTKTLIPPISLSYKKRTYSPSRIRYPLKRVDFDPHGERNIQNRGTSKYIRISWDEALDIIATEIKRIQETYTTNAILYQSDAHGENKTVHACHGCGRKLLKLLGGYTLQSRNPDSWEGWVWGAKHVWGMEPVGQQVPSANVIPDIAENSELLLFWGCDQETTPWGWGGQLPSRLSYWFTELGIQQIYISPDLNYAAGVHADRWIPIRPNTDAALYLAIAYIWITEDTYDKEYVATHTHGFKKFADYVLGKEDGIPKTPKWASEITGVPARIATALARLWASKRTSIVIGNGGPGIRGPYSSEPARLQVLLLAMQGLGKPGVQQVKMLEWGMFDSKGQYPLPKAKMRPSLHAGYRGGYVSETNPSFIPKTLVPDAILNPPVTWYGCESEMARRDNQFVKYTFPFEGCPDIHMIWSDSPCWITCWNEGNRIVEAFRDPKIEFVLAQHPWLENDCLLADIILPANTVFEVPDISQDTLGGQYSIIFLEEKCIEPIGESRSDYEIVCAIAERLGVLEEYTEGKSAEEWIKTAFDHSRVQDMVSWEQLTDKGYYVIPTDPDWQQDLPGLRKFYNDPENNRLRTPTGKIEFESVGLKEHFPDDEERPPVPHWIPYGKSHQESLLHARSGEYPFLLVSNHPRWGVHANHEDISWLREIPTCKVRGPDGYQYQPVWIHPIDAAAKGISKGDIVKIFNERGIVLAGAYVTERIIPGTISVDHGAKYDPIVPGKIDRGGAINTITPRHTTSQNVCGMVISGFLVNIERADLDELRKQYPKPFSRHFHAATGLTLESFLEAK